MVNTSLGVANTVIGNHTEKLKYSRTSRMKKHVLKMAQALSLCGSDGRNCILYAALSGQTLVLDFAMRVMSEARHIREVVNSRAVEAMKAEVVLTSSEKTATILAAEQTEDAAALIAEAALSADLDAAAASNIVSASKTSDASPLSSKVTRDRAPPMTARGVATPLRNLYQGSPLTAGTDEGRHSGAKGKQHLTTAEELRSDSSSDDELPETPPPPVVEVERVWSRRTSLRYKQLTTEKMQKDLIEKKRVAAEETARINVCLFPDVLEVSTSFVEWCEDDATSSVALAMSGNTRCLSHLLDSSFDPYTVSTGGVTLAMVAAKEGQCNVLDLLMEREIDLSRRDDCDKNVFHYAATCAKWNVISFLLTHAKSKQCKNAILPCLLSYTAERC